MTVSANIANAITLAGLAAIAYMLSRKQWSSDLADSVTQASSYPNPGGATLGYRNNNPLNIEYRSGTVWQGEIRPSGHYRFAQFVSLPYGYRAGFVTIRTYNLKYGIDTVRGIISRWDSGNAANYINFVCQKTGWSPNKQISFSNRDEMVSLVSAMSWMENGIKPDPSTVSAGYKLYENA